LRPQFVVAGHRPGEEGSPLREAGEKSFIKDIAPVAPLVVGQGPMDIGHRPTDESPPREAPDHIQCMRTGEMRIDDKSQNNIATTEIGSSTWGGDDRDCQASNLKSSTVIKQSRSANVSSTPSTAHSSTSRKSVRHLRLGHDSLNTFGSPIGSSRRLGGLGAGRLGR
jgi:hypothetical protein